MVGHRPIRFDPRNVLAFRPEPSLPGRLIRILRRRTSGRGELRLALAVLEDAFHCLGCIEGSRGSINGRHRREAREWIESRDREGLFTFESVCAVLGLEADAIRRLLGRVVERRIPDEPFFPELPRVAGADPGGRSAASPIRRIKAFMLVS